MMNDDDEHGEYEYVRDGSDMNDDTYQLKGEEKGKEI